MRFRETTLGRAVHRLPAGEQLLAFGGKAMGLLLRLKERRRNVLTIKRNIREASRMTGIKYRPPLGYWPFYLKSHRDAWFTAKFPDGEKMRIHWTIDAATKISMG